MLRGYLSVLFALMQMGNPIGLRKKNQGQTKRKSPNKLN